MASPIPPQHAAGELRQVVQVNEEIKTVVRTAFKTNIMALNAIFLAKRAGDAARGFGVLSDELRRFAVDLARQMDDLRNLTVNSVSIVTSLVKQSRMARILDRVTANEGETGRRLAEIRAREQREVEEKTAQLATFRHKLGGLLEDIDRLVDLGSVLARSAKIEAAYGGSYAPSLMQLSTEFDHTIGSIRESLDTLKRSINTR